MFKLLRFKETLSNDMSNDRKLATIDVIKDLAPIPNADNIVLARIRGWNVVVGVNEFSVGDKCVYYEIDSFLPCVGLYEFMRKTSYKKYGEVEGFRLATRKFKGQLSQGLAIPLINVAEAYNLPELKNMEVGSNVTELLGVTKYEPPISKAMQGACSGRFPFFIPKTDEERIQNLEQSTLEELINTPLYATEKLDGTSITIYVKDGQVGLCSRNLELKLDADNLYTQAFNQLNLKEKLEKYYEEHNQNLALQGELIGPGIQGNRYDLKQYQVKWFTAYDITQGIRLDYEGMCTALDQLGLSTVNTVPLVAVQVDGLRRTELDRWLSVADAPSKLNPNIRREGIVVRGKSNPNLSFKVINNKYLLKYQD